MAGELTVLLRRVAAGDQAAREPLFRALYPELAKLARSHVARAGTTMSLDASAVIHEAYLRFAGDGKLPGANRRAFFAYASKVMRSVIVDHLRERGAAKRGGGAEELTLTGADVLIDRSILDVDEALKSLAQVDERGFQVVEMRYFGGLREEDVADALDVSVATVRRDWRRARACLYELLR